MRDLLVKYEKLSVQAKSAIWFAMCSVLQKGIAYVTVPIFTRLIHSEQFGSYNIYLSWVQILTIVSSLYLYHGVFNNGMTKFSSDRDTYISSMQGLTLTLNTILLIVYIVAYRLWSRLLDLSPMLVLLMFVEMAVTPAIQFWLGRQRFELRYKLLVLVTLSKTIANPILGIIMVWYSQQKDVARILSVVIVEVLFCGTIMIIQFARGKCFFHRYYWKYALRLAIPLIPHYLSGMILNQGDRIVIDRLVGKSEVAFYSVAYSVGMVVQIVTSSMINTVTPWLYLKMKSKDCGSVKGILNQLLIIVSVTAFGIMLCSPELVKIFGSEGYESAVYVVPPVAASVFFIFLYNMLAIPQFYYEKTYYLAISSVIAAGLNIFLNIVFINRFGYLAAGYTTLVCYVLYCLGHYCVSRRILKKNAEGAVFYDTRMILILSSIMVFFGISCNYLFAHSILRYVLILVILLVAFIKRKTIISRISGLKESSD